MPEELLDPDKAAEPDMPEICGASVINWRIPRPEAASEMVCHNEMEPTTAPDCADERHLYCPDHCPLLHQALGVCNKVECAEKEIARLQHRRLPQPPRRPQLPAGRKA